MSKRVLTAHQQSLITDELIRYADALARRYMGCGLDLADLQQEARYGLCQAVCRFDEASDASLKTFATFYIRKYVILAIKEYGCLMHVSKEDRALLKIISLDGELTDSVDAGVDGLTDDEDETPVDNLTGALADESEQEDETRQENKRRVATLLKVLTPKEREVIEVLFGMPGTQMRFAEAAALLKMKPERLRVLYRQALAKMREAAGGE